MHDFISNLFELQQAEKVGKCSTEEEEKKKPPSLRRHYPVQVLRVSSQPNQTAKWREGLAPRELKKPVFRRQYKDTGNQVIH